MELCTQKTNTNNKNPNENTDTGKPLVVFAPGARAVAFLTALHSPKLMLLPLGCGALKTLNFVETSFIRIKPKMQG